MDLQSYKMKSLENKLNINSKYIELRNSLKSDEWQDNKYDECTDILLDYKFASEYIENAVIELRQTIEAAEEYDDRALESEYERWVRGNN